ncbi:serine hydrolase domain-containing protein [Flagellimonas sp. 2504JD4-2]
MKTLVRFLGILIFFCMFTSCGQEKTTSPRKDLKGIFKMAQKSPNIHSFLASHKGELVVEKYYTNYEKDTLDDIRSGTKSIMTTLVGIAIDKGYIESVNDAISKYLEVPKDKSEITIAHLMSMQSGIQWNENSSPDDRTLMIRSGNPKEYILSKQVTSKPGTFWTYNSGDTHLLSIVLTEATGMSTLEFAEKHLFGPLAIEKVGWKKFGDGYHPGDSRLEVSPRDLVKLGEMVAHEGEYRGRRIVSKQFLEDAAQFHYTHANASEKSGYGYGWWVTDHNKKRVMMALGYGGQMIGIVPDEDLVVVVTHFWNVNANDATNQQKNAQQLAITLWDWIRSTRE